LAYYLLLLEDKAYVVYASAHVEELAAHHEFRIWTVVLEDQSWEMADGYRESLIGVLEHADIGYAKLAVANHLLRTGESAKAVDMLLALFAEGTGWWSTGARSVLLGLLESQKAELLTPYLETPSLQGAYVAYLLAGIEVHLDQAMSYLGELKETDDPGLVEAATRLLDNLGGATPNSF